MEKIDSKEKWEHYCEVEGIDATPPNSLKAWANSRLSTCEGAYTGLSDKDLEWWIAREHHRIASSYYQVTPQIKWVNDVYKVFAHVSKKDKGLIAYTPDNTSGRDDRQLAVTPGKFFSRFMPLFTDHIVAKVTEAHLANALATITWVQGYEGIKEVYSSSVASCMSKEAMHAMEYHPCVVYDTPMIRMATTRDKEGRVNGRCLVREDTKKYIRVYGNPSLKTLLELEGYKPGTWGGMEFRTEKKGDHYYAPYLDANNTLGSEDYSTLILRNGKLVCLTKEQAQGRREALRNLNMSTYAYMAMPGQHGFVALEELDESRFSYQDYITGEIISRLSYPAKKLWHLGKVREVITIPEGAELALRITEDRSKEGIAILPGEGTFSHNARLYIDTPAARRFCGYTKLDPELYPEDQEWVSSSLTTRINNGMVIIRTCDAVTIIKSCDGTVSNDLYHKSAVTKAHVKVHSSTRGEMVYAEQGVKVVKSRGGRKLVEGYHAVYTLIDGTHEFKTKCETYAALGEDYYYVPEIKNLLPQAVIEGVGRCLDEAGETWGHRLRREYYIVHPKSYKEALDVLKHRCRDTHLGNGVIRWLGLKIAEAEAVEAPHRLVDASTLVDA